MFANTIMTAVQGASGYAGYLREFLPAVLLLGIGLVLSLVFLAIAKIFAPASPDAEKVSTYECGFNAFDDSRMKFDVKFYRVAILFIIFDLEVAFLFPFAVTIGQGMTYVWAVVMIFLIILTIGFIYEWKKGALDWE